MQNNNTERTFDSNNSKELVQHTHEDLPQHVHHNKDIL
jgi:hypothetical protein